MKTTKIFNLAIAVLAFLMPLFFLPLTADFYFFNKMTLLYFSVALLLIGWAVKVYQNQKLSLEKMKFGLPLLGFLLVLFVSLIFQAPNKIASLANSVGVILSLSLLYLIIVNNTNKKAVGKMVISLIVASVLLAWLTVFAYLGIGENLSLDWLQTKAWTPTGAPLNTLSLMLILLPATLFWAFKSKSGSNKLLLFLAAALQILASILIISLITNKTVPFLYLPPQFGWQIGVEGFKNLRTGLLGVGPGNFVSAFTQFKPLRLNDTDLWAIRFGTSSNEYFNLLSTVGLLGVGFYLWLVIKAVRKENQQGFLKQRLLYLLLVSCFVSQLLLPTNIIIWFIIFAGLGLMEVTQKPLEAKKVYRTKTKPVILGACGLVGLLALFVFYGQGRLWLADFHFRQSLLALQENKGLETYNSQIQALRLNPFNENYRVAYAETNFALANSLASQAEVSDQDRASITQLISQSVREAKVAINLNPQISSHWLNLAQIYRNLTNFAEGADQWGMAAYQQAILLDPANPIIRLNLGGLFYGLGHYEEAIKHFSNAVNLKPNYANGHYNLAMAYRELGKYQEAFNSLQIVLNLVPADSTDYQTVLAELEALKAKLPSTETLEEAPEEPAELTPPEPLPLPVVEPPIELPEELSPEDIEEPEATPSPSPSP